VAFGNIVECKEQVAPDQIISLGPEGLHKGFLSQN